MTNNWWPTEVLGGPLYEPGTAANSLFDNSLQAFYEFNPIVEDSLIYRSQRFGKHLEIFFPDYRSYRDPNPGNSERAGIAMMGREQLDWLKNGLLNSDATWKIISSHDPIGIVTGGPGDRDSFGQEDPAILGRELEIGELLGFIHTNDISNVVSLSSDVHFVHVNMDPSRAAGGFTAYKPLDEFVIGPINAGAFGPNAIDSSFGPEYVYGMWSKKWFDLCGVFWSLTFLLSFVWNYSNGTRNSQSPRQHSSCENGSAILWSCLHRPSHGQPEHSID